MSGTPISHIRIAGILISLVHVTTKTPSLKFCSNLLQEKKWIGGSSASHNPGERAHASDAALGQKTKASEPEVLLRLRWVKLH